MSERIEQQSTFIEPAELFQPEPNACVSCVTANVMYMFGKLDYPDIKLIDMELGRQPREALVFNTAYLYLLKQGFSMHFIDEFDEDAFIDRGLSYLKEYYADSWTGSSFDEYWTPEKVEERQQARKLSRSEFNAHGSNFISEAKTPTVDDIDALLSDNQVVLITVKGSSPGVTHATLVYGKENDGTYKFYQPTPFTPGSYNITRLGAYRSYLDRELVPDEGIVGITLR